MRHLPGLAWIKDLQGRYVYANDAAEKAFRICGVVHLQHLRRLSARASMDHIDDHEIPQPWTHGLRVAELGKMHSIGWSKQWP
jgi:hypothetical protein